MQNIRIMFKSPRFVIGLAMVLIVVAYAVAYPIMNTDNPKENRMSNPDYAKVETLYALLNADDGAGALTEIERLRALNDPALNETLAALEMKIVLTAAEKGLSGAKQVKGSKYPDKEEFDDLRAMLTLPEDVDEAGIEAAVAKAAVELDALAAHHSALFAAAKEVKAQGAAAIAAIADAEVRAEFEEIIESENLAEAVAALVASHEKNDEWVGKVRARLAGEGLEYDEARKVLSDGVPQSFLIEKDQPPSPEHPLGTDMLSRDVLLEMAHGARLSLLVGLTAGVIATIIGLGLGLFAGYVGKAADNVISAFTNLFLVIPSFVILILISVALGQIREAWITGLVIGLTAWPWTAKSVRAQTTSLRYRDHVNMARITGYSTPRILLTEIMPYIASYVVMAFILQVASGIMAEATLAILGLGDPTAISLGRMISWAQQYESIVNGRWWEFMPVAICIAMITFGLYMMNSGMDQVFNPKIRS